MSLPSIQEHKLDVVNKNNHSSSNRAQHTFVEEQQTHAERWSEANIQKAIKTWRLTEEQTQQLRSLKDKLSDKAVDHWKNTPHEVVRYIKGPKGFDEAEPIFRKMIEWRKTSQENIDDLLDTYKAPRALYEYAPSGLLKQVDKDGDPVYLERAGDMDGYGFVNRYDHDTMLRDVVWRRELTSSGAWITDYEAEHGHLPRQITVVYDLKGLSSRHMKKGVGAFFKDAVAYTSDKYYGVSKRMIIIRAPSIFRMVWRVVQTFFAPEVREKMVFAGKDHLETLNKYMDLNILPPCIYDEGVGKATRGFPRNFEGGFVPVDFDDDEEYSTSDADACSTVQSSVSFDDDAQSVVSNVSGKMLMKGSLKLSDCGKLFHLDHKTVMSF